MCYHILINDVMELNLLSLCTFVPAGLTVCFMQQGIKFTEGLTRFIWFLPVRWFGITRTAGAEIRKNFMTGHKFTLSTKSAKVSIYVRRDFFNSSFLDHREMAFQHLNRKVTLLEKTTKWNKLFFKKHQMLFTSQNFFLLACGVYSHFEFKLKK